MDSEIPPVSNSAPPLPPRPPVGAPPILTPLPPPRGLPRQPTPGGTAGWKVAGIILLIVLAVSLWMNFRHFARGVFSHQKATRHHETVLQEVLVEDNGSKNKIALIDVAGVITSGAERGGEGMVKFIDEQLKIAAQDKSVKAVILKVDSPGGEVLASDDIYNLIKNFQRNNSKPVVASMGSLAASGGYYVSAPCQWIVANELTITGSIGVIMHGYNYRGLMDKVGVRPEVYKSGKFKDMMSGEKKEGETSEEERQMLQALINETFGKFKKIVAEGRNEARRKNSKGQALASNWEEFADGRILSGKQALELGFVDELGNFDTAVAAAEKLAHIEDADLIEYRQPFDFSNIFRLLGKTEARAVKVDLGLNTLQLQSGHLYFILPTVLH